MTQIASSECLQEIVKYLTELKTDLAHVGNMGTKVQASLVPAGRCMHGQIVTDSQQLTGRYADASQDDLLVAKLPFAEGASFDSRLQQHEPQCLADTRE